jgi:hypothetical protein
MPTNAVTLWARADTSSLILTTTLVSAASTATQSSSATMFDFPSPLLFTFLPISLQALEVNWSSDKNTELTGPGQSTYPTNLALPYIQGHVGNIIDHCSFTTIAGQLAGGQMFDTAATALSSVVARVSPPTAHTVHGSSSLSRLPHQLCFFTNASAMGLRYTLSWLTRFGSPWSLLAS